MTHSGPLWRVGDLAAAALYYRLCRCYTLEFDTRKRLVERRGKLEAEDGCKRTAAAAACSVLFQVTARKNPNRRKRRKKQKIKKHTTEIREKNENSASAKKHCGNGLG